MAKYVGPASDIQRRYFTCVTFLNKGSNPLDVSITAIPQLLVVAVHNDEDLRRRDEVVAI